MVLVAVLGALVVGGFLGALIRRRTGRTGAVGRPTEDSASTGAHAGFSNSAPFDANP